ncbi:MAG: amino acid adenylation domain-containing protein [Caldilineales bacterium]|nr:amino acid adenylation domain-containing protein [Caldilineales bacterium]
MTTLEQRIANLTPQQLALLEKRLRQTQTKTTIPRRSPDESAPLSFGQQRFWFIHELEEDKSLFNNVSAARIKGELDVRALEGALRALIIRHAVLRTVYRTNAHGELEQVILKDWSFAIQQHDLSRIIPNTENPEQIMQEHLLSEAHRRFDLANELSLRASLYTLAENDYVFCEIHHHIATDFWSSGILYRELVKLYDAIRHGATEGEAISQLPELPIEYADFAVWQRQQAQTEGFQKQLAYWRQQLSPPLPMLTLPTDSPRSATQNHRGGTDSTHISLAQIQRMKELGQTEKATQFIVAATAFLALFHRYSRQNDLVVGVINAGRNRVELENLIGAFINTLVFRVDAGGNPTFRQFLARVRQVALDAFANQDAPFEQIVAEVQPERTLSESPLVEILLDFLNTPSSPRLLPDVEYQRIAVNRGTAEYDMLIAGRPQPHGLQIDIRYKSTLFNADTIQRMLEHLHILLDAALEDPDTPIDALPLMSESERQQILVGWNATARPIPDHLTFVQLFEEQAESNRHAPAVDDGGQRLSYGELNRRANRLARALVAHGIVSQQIVPLLADRNSNFLVTMLAIWKAGGVYLPIDPRLPPLRVRQMLKQSGAEVLLASPMHADLAKSAIDTGQANAIVCLDLEALLAEEHADDNLDPLSSPIDLAYVLYTSGSTGVPKGAMIEHRGMLNHLFAKVHDLELTSGDKVAQNSPQSFDISIWQFLVALLVGAQTRVYADEIAFDPSALLDHVESDGVTIFEAVPSLLQAMLDVADSKSSVAGLRWLIPTGEAMPPGLARAWLLRYPHLKLMNAYGPTECSDDVTHYIISGPPQPQMANLPIGRPVDNMRIYVLDEHLQPTPIGIPGEIYVGGVGVGRGYLRDPERTADAFIPDPFDTKTDARLYRTGDLGRWLAEGNIEFLGRVDFQVKIRGHRIELGEIEHALLEHPGVSEAAVLALDDERGALQLAAYVAVRPDENQSAAGLREHLGERLPSYMIPASFSILAAPDTLPKTPSGKIDRKALARLQVMPGIETEFVAPSTETEQAIAEIWSDLLGIEPIGVHDNFFDLGGHSLIAAQLVHRLRQSIAPDLPLRALFEHPTIAGLAKQLSTFNLRHSTFNFQSLLPLQTHGSRPPLFFLPGGGGSEDEYLIYAGLLNRLGPDQPVYGFIARGLDGESDPHDSVPQMAADYVAELRNVQPHGPYFLGGECIGGKVALEMARILEEEGEEIGLLALMNTFVRGTADERSLDERLLATPGVRQLRRRWRELSRLPAEQRWDRLRQMAVNATRVAVPLNEEQREARRERAQKLGVQAMLGEFRPEPYAGDVTLLVTSDTRERISSAWQSLLKGRIDIAPLPGIHANYLGENVEGSARALNETLESHQTVRISHS